MKEVFNKLVAEFGLELRKDYIDDETLACYHGRVVMYLLTPGLIDILYSDGRYYSSSSETQCRAWLNDILPYLKKQELERKILRMESDFE